MIKKINFSFLFLSLLFLPSAQCFTRSNFEVPESFVSDPETGIYYVSNIKGGPLDKDGNGYISKISANGNIAVQKFIGGKADGVVLNAPKGLLVMGSELWTTDIDVVRVFNKRTGSLIRVIDASPLGAKFLNDIAYDGERGVYVSDMLGDQILKMDIRSDNKLTIFKKGSELGNPNGLVFNPENKNLMVVTFKSGEIFEIDAAGTRIVLQKGLSSLDGIDYDSQGNLYVSSFDKGEIYKIPSYGRGELTIFQKNLTTPADISCDRKRNDLLVPSFKGNTVMTVYFFEKAMQEKNSGSG